MDLFGHPSEFPYSHNELWKQQHAALRPGIKDIAYELEWYEFDPDATWLERMGQKLMLQGPPILRHTVRFTHEEWKHLMQVTYPKRSKGDLAPDDRKVVTAYVVQHLWGGSTKDDLVMASLGLIAWNRYLEYQYVTSSRGCCFCIDERRLYPSIMPLPQRENNGQTDGSGEGNKPETSQGKKSDQGEGGSQQKDDGNRPKAQQNGVKPIGPADEGTGRVDMVRWSKENKVLAGEFGDERTFLTEGGWVGVRGMLLSGGKSTPTEAMVGAMIGPCEKEPNVPDNRKVNAESAIDERIHAKQRIPTSAELKQMRKVCGPILKLAMSKHKNDEVYAIWSPYKIECWASKVVGISTEVSKKWSTMRTKNSVEQLMNEVFPVMRLKAAIKAEPMPEGKPPRLLLSTGDEGQLMALLVVKCFEELMFEHFPEVCTKHRTRDENGDQTAQYLSDPARDVSIIEGDGSAWDTTCTKPVRDIVENPIFRQIATILVNFGLCPPQWYEVFLTHQEKQKYKIYFTEVFEKVSFEIDAIRTSGGRETSSGNFWMNWINWVSIVYPEKVACKFLNPEKRSGTDIFGKCRRLSIKAEGDDSALMTCPPVKSGSDVAKAWEDEWWKRGFNMKIIYATEKRRCTFVGIWFVVDDHGCTGEWVAEIPRALKNWGISCSPAAKACIADLKKGVAVDKAIAQLKVIRASVALARAYDFAGKLNVLASKFLTFAKEYGTIPGENNCDATRELSMRVNGRNGEIKSIIQTIEDRMARPTDDAKVSTRFGLDVTKCEIDRLMRVDWTPDPIDMLKWSDSMYSRSLPAAWKS